VSVQLVLSSCSLGPAGSLSQAASGNWQHQLPLCRRQISDQGLCRLAGRRRRQKPEETDSKRPEPESRVYRMCYWKQPRAAATREEGRAEGKWRRAAAAAEPRHGCSALLGGGRAAHFFSLHETESRLPRGICCGPWELRCRPPTAPLSARADSTINLSWACMGCSLFLAEEAFSLSPAVWSMQCVGPDEWVRANLAIVGRRRDSD
jgi:hypothetical protein